MTSKDPSLDSRPVAIITGAIRGIGLAVARELAVSGVRCVLTYYDWLDDLDAMHRTMKETGQEYVAVSVDLTTAGGAKKVVQTALEEMGGVHILVNNIERGGWPIVHGPYTEDQWNLEFKTTITAKWYLFQEVFPVMKAQGIGSVVNISSISALSGRSGPAAMVFNDCYSLSNRAVGLLTETWARQGAPDIRVNEVMLGFVETRHGPKTRGWGLLSDSQRAAIADHTLLGRIATPEEVARVVRFVALEASFMTGAIVRVDGGYVLGGDGAEPMPKGVVGPEEPAFGGSISPGTS